MSGARAVIRSKERSESSPSPREENTQASLSRLASPASLLNPLKTLLTNDHRRRWMAKLVPWKMTTDSLHLSCVLDMRRYPLEKRDDLWFIGGPHLSSGCSAAPLLNCHHGFPRRKKERKSGTFTQREKKTYLAATSRNSARTRAV